MSAQGTALLSVRDLCVAFRGAARPVLESVSFELHRGRTLALLGPSGSGKSLTALSLLGLLPPGAQVLGGQARLGGPAGPDLLQLSEAGLRGVRGRRIGLVFQEPQSALNPVMRVGAQVAEVLRRHAGLSRRQAGVESVALLDAVGITAPARRAGDYPYQFSGGMKQRALIAMALAAGPELLIADEPTTALDLTVQAQVLDLLQRLQAERELALLFITHDLGVAARMADRVAVFDQGRVVEQAGREAFFSRPSHPCSQRMFAQLRQRGRLAGADDGAPGPGRAGAAWSPASAAPAPSRAAVLAAESLVVEFRMGGRLWPLRGRARRPLRAVDGVSLRLAEGEILAVVGESGSGKTTLARALTALVPASSGRLHFAGRALTGLSGRALREARRGLQMVFQDPYASLNPRMRIGTAIEEVLRLHSPPPAPAVSTRRVEALLREVGLEPGWRVRYPHQLSGGQRQRVCIARALAASPRLLVCDEPTSALDLGVRSQILALLARLRREHGLACLVISHDLDVVAALADRVMVMAAGRVVEQGETRRVLRQPAHPCTRRLLDAVLTLPAQGRA